MRAVPGGQRGSLQQAEKWPQPVQEGGQVSRGPGEGHRAESKAGLLSHKEYPHFLLPHPCPALRPQQPWAGGLQATGLKALWTKMCLGRPDGPEVRASRCHCREHGFDPWSGS